MVNKKTAGDEKGAGETTIRTSVMFSQELVNEMSTFRSQGINVSGFIRAAIIFGFSRYIEILEMAQPSRPTVRYPITLKPGMVEALDGLRAAGINISAFIRAAVEYRVREWKNKNDKEQEAEKK